MRTISLALCLLLLGSPAIAQDSTTALPASLLRRLAEVADGQGLASNVFIVARYAFPHEVVGVFKTREEAERARRAPGLGVFGPLRRAIEDLDWFLTAGCRHDRTSSAYGICPDAPVVPVDEVVSVTITTRLRNGDSVSTVLSRGTDAVFFTVDAMDKFAFTSYYPRLVGVQEAARMRETLLAGIRQKIR